MKTAIIFKAIGQQHTDQIADAARASGFDEVLEAESEEAVLRLVAENHGKIDAIIASADHQSPATRSKVIKEHGRPNPGAQIHHLIKELRGTDRTEREFDDHIPVYVFVDDPNIEDEREGVIHFAWPIHPSKEYNFSVIKLPPACYAEDRYRVGLAKAMEDRWLSQKEWLDDRIANTHPNQTVWLVGDSSIMYWGEAINLKGLENLGYQHIRRFSSDEEVQAAILDARMDPRKRPSVIWTEYSVNRQAWKLDEPYHNDLLGPGIARQCRGAFGEDPIILLASGGGMERPTPRGGIVDDHLNMYGGHFPERLEKAMVHAMKKRVEADKKMGNFIEVTSQELTQVDRNALPPGLYEAEGPFSERERSKLSQLQRVR